jgi:hypothetical protein
VHSSPALTQIGIVTPIDADNNFMPVPDDRLDVQKVSKAMKSYMERANQHGIYFIHNGF